MTIYVAGFKKITRVVGLCISMSATGRCVSVGNFREFFGSAFAARAPLLILCICTSMHVQSTRCRGPTYRRPHILKCNDTVRALPREGYRDIASSSINPSLAILPFGFNAREKKIDRSIDRSALAIIEAKRCRTSTSTIRPFFLDRFGAIFRRRT